MAKRLLIGAALLAVVTIVTFIEWRGKPTTESVDDGAEESEDEGDIQHRTKEEMEGFEDLERAGLIPEGSAQEYWTPEKFRRYVHSGNYQNLLRASDSEEVAKQVDAFVVPGAGSTVATADGESVCSMNIGFDIHDERAAWMHATTQLDKSGMGVTLCQMDPASETFRGAITLELAAVDKAALERLVATGSCGRPVLVEFGRKSGVSTLGRADGTGGLQYSPTEAREFKHPVESLRPIASGTCERMRQFLSTMAKLSTAPRVQHR